MRAMESSSTEVGDLERIRGVTANFFFWQGLRWVPMGCALIIFGLTPVAKRFIGSPWLDIITYGSFFLALWLSTDVLGRYYTSTYGRVQGIPGQHSRRVRIKWLLVYPAMIAAMIIDAKLNGPIFLSGIVFGAGIESYRRSTGGGRRHYTVAAILVALLSLVPLSGLFTSRQMLIPFLSILGAIYVIGGILDHRELARILAPTRSETVPENGSTV